MTQETRYLLLGHPAWPGNLSTANEDYARAWYEEHKDAHPVYVDVIRSTRERLEPRP